MKKAEKTKAAIIAKTAPLFNKKGYAGTALSDLTDITGLTKGALYGNFKNKDEIALAAYDYNTKKVIDRFLMSADKSRSSIERLLSAPRFYRECYKEVVEMGGCPILNAAVDSDDGHPALRKKVNATIKAWANDLAKTMRQGIANGEIRKDIDPVAYSRLFLVLFEGSIMLSKVTGDKSYVYEATGRISSIIETELAAR
jgi:TetR/AcrR family transcriptional regulator, transcriptional repressor for nem operon